MPTYLMLLAARKSVDQIDAGDIGFSALMVAFVAATFVADQQQWSKSIISIIRMTSRLTEARRLPKREKGLSKDGQSSDPVPSRRP